MGTVVAGEGTDTDATRPAGHRAKRAAVAVAAVVAVVAAVLLLGVPFAKDRASARLFPDDGFRACVAEELGVAPGRLVDADLVSVEVLECDGAVQVRSVDGIGELPSLTSLSLSRARLADGEALVDATRLEYLRLEDEYLDLSGCRGIGAMPALTEVSLDGMNLDHSECFELMAANAGLVSLSITDPQGVDPDRGIIGLRYMANLTSLMLADGDFAATMAPVTYLTELTNLDLHDTRVRDISALKDLHSLEQLRIVWSPVRDLAPLAGASNLTSVDLTGVEATDFGVISNWTSLTRLALDRTYATSLEPLRGMQHLESLSADDTEITDLSPLAGLPELTDLSLRRVNVDDGAALACLPKLDTSALHVSPLLDVPTECAQG